MSVRTPRHPDLYLLSRVYIEDTKPQYIFKDAQQLFTHFLPEHKLEIARLTDGVGGYLRRQKIYEELEKILRGLTDDKAIMTLLVAERSQYSDREIVTYESYNPLAFGLEFFNNYRRYPFPQIDLHFPFSLTKLKMLLERIAATPEDTVRGEWIDTSSST